MYGLKMTRDATGSIINFIGTSKKRVIRIDRPEPLVAEPLAAAVHPHAHEIASNR